MAKIEEITELLVNEISSFEQSVERLERVSEKLHSAKIGIDVKEYKSLLENHQKQMRVVLDAQERLYNRYESLLKNAKIYPNWAVIVFIVSILFGVVSTLYIFFNEFY